MKRLFAVLLLVAGIAFAQINVTSVTGTVTDPDRRSRHLARPFRPLELATGVKFDATTNDKGEYAIPSIPAGAYRVSVNKAGFKGEQVDNVTVIVDVPGTVNVKLVVGQTSGNR